MMGMELKGARAPSVGEMTNTEGRGGVDGLPRAIVAAVAFGLLMALWVILWIPSAPVP
jgi:hypothetical protein